MKRLRPRTPAGSPGARLAAILPCLAVGLPAPAQQLSEPLYGQGQANQDVERSVTGQAQPGSSESWFHSTTPDALALPPAPGLGTSALPVLGESPLPRPAGYTASPTPASAPQTAPFQWGKLMLNPHLSYGLVYGTGILTGPGQEEPTALQTLSPGLTIHLGPRWSLDYTPSLQFYSNSEYEDTLDHALSLRGSAVGPNWLFTLGYGFSSSSPPLIETAAQTAQDTHGLTLGADHALDARTTLQLGVAQYFRFAESYTDSYTWTTTDWMDYAWDARFATGVGFSLGYDLLDPGTDMTNERLLGRIRGEVGTKFRYSLVGGVEWRQFLDSDVPAKLSPTVEGTLDYRLLEATTISISASHETGASYFDDQFTETTSLGGGVRQRLLGKFYLGLSGGYSIQDYASTLATDSTQRSDDRVYFQTGLSGRFLKRVDTSVFYRYADNASDEAGFSSRSNQVGFQLSAGW